MWVDLILSTVAFFVASFWLRRFFDQQGFPHGFARSTMVLIIAMAASFAMSAIVSRIIVEPTADQQIAHMLKQGLIQNPSVDSH